MSLDLTEDRSTLVKVMAWCDMASAGHSELNIKFELKLVHLYREFWHIGTDASTPVDLVSYQNAPHL